MALLNLLIWSLLAFIAPLQQPSLPLVASRYRLWSPETGDPVSLVSYAVPLADLAFSDDYGRTAAWLTIGWRERNGSRGEWFDTTLVRAYYPATSSRDGFLQALIIAEREHDAASWQFGIAQGESRRAVVADSTAAPLGEGPLTLSDIVIGDSTQHFAWLVAGDSIVLAPRGSVSRNIVVSLFVQLRAATDIKDARTTVSVYRRIATGRDPEPALQIAWTANVARGIAAIQRELDISRLDVGDYDMEITVVGGSNQTARSRRLVVR